MNLPITDETPEQEAEFELRCDGEFAAGASGPRASAWRDIQHYAAQYAQDGPIEIYEVHRTRVYPA